MSITKKIRNIFLALLALVFLVALSIIFHEKLLEFKYFVGYALSSQYKHDRELIKPYFDEKFYMENYGLDVQKSGLAPIDHFLRKGWYSSNWRNHTDPNPWFNTTLYQERLWSKSQNNEHKNLFKIRTNPFIDFLNQPKLKIHNKNVEVWAKKDELARAWLATESLMRLNRFNVILHIPKNIKPENLVRFIPQARRGLKLLVDNKNNKSFYHSDFIKNPNKYKLTDLKLQKNIHAYTPITYTKQDFSYLMHRLYSYTDWINIGTINPSMINIAHYCDEPLAYAPFPKNIMARLTMILKVIASKELSSAKYRAQNLKEYLARISDGFDLCLTGVKLPIKNLKIIPGYMAIWVNEKELDKNKEFSISFLLTKKYKKSGAFNYKLRNKIWEREKDFKIPTKFYLSYRHKDSFPKKLQHRTIPTDSKKWVLNSQFNIAIENTAQKYYFTEKLLDCFIALTVPIYIGCPNITDYFDPRGMIIVHSLDELINAVNSITPETYYSMLPYLKENKRRALRFLDLEKEIIAEFGKKLLT